MASLLIVDAVIIFEEDTPQELIGALLPDVLVKGGIIPLTRLLALKK